MSIELEYYPEGASTGYIRKVESIPATYEGNDETYATFGRVIGSKPNPSERTNAYLNFETGGTLPDRAIIEKVEVYSSVFSTISSSGLPAAWYQDYYMGKDIIQGGLETNEDAIWNDANWVLCVHDSGQPTSEWIDLSYNGRNTFNRTGDTDIQIEDDSNYSTQGGWSVNLYGDYGGRSSKLRVTYRIGQILNAKIYNAKIYTEVSKK